MSDPTAGLEYQPWMLTVAGSPFPNQFVLSAPNFSPTVIYTYPNIIQCSLAFDPNMHAAIAYTAQDGPQLWWYNATLPGYNVLTLPAGSQNPQVTLDDKRDLQQREGTIDIILTYTRDNNLYYRQLRDRFTIEYLLMLNVPISNPYVIKVGMNNGWRLQWTIGGNLYQ